MGNLSIGYYEMKVLVGGEQTSLAIGVALPLYQRSMPGWGAYSWAVHGDEGRVYQQRGYGVNFTEKWQTGETFGIGINYNSGDIFFTRNGQFVGFIANDVQICRYLFPTIGLAGAGEKCVVN